MAAGYFKSWRKASGVTAPPIDVCRDDRAQPGVISTILGTTGSLELTSIWIRDSQLTAFAALTNWTAIGLR